MIHERKGRHRERYEHKIFSKSWEGKNWQLTVSVVSYKGGAPRLLISREKKSKYPLPNPFAKLGKLTKEEAEGIFPIFQEALHHMR